MTYDLNNEMDLIEKYLDGALTLQEEAQVEQLLSERADLREEYHNMKTAIESVRYTGLNRQVAAIAKEYHSKQIKPEAETRTVKIRSIGFYAMRAAAVVLVSVASYSAIMYTTATPDRIYNNGFVTFDLAATRNNSQSTAIEHAYKNAEWKQVLNLSSAEEKPGQETLFLAGMASLQLNQAQQATDYFQKVIDLNTATGNDLYMDESQFYQALSYVKLNDGAKAYALFQNIRNNPLHTYYKNAGNINLLKVKLLKWKK